MSASTENQLIRYARQLGVSDACLIDAADIRVEDRLADICRDPGCPGYGQGANCAFEDVVELDRWPDGINLRFRDGTIYQAQPTDINGEYSLEEVFPFFKWIVVEVELLFVHADDVPAGEGLGHLGGNGAEVLADDGDLFDELSGPGVLFSFRSSKRRYDGRRAGRDRRGA